jgi:hypothetical protein
MIPLTIYAKVTFYEYDETMMKINGTYKNGRFLCFSIREDTLSSGKIDFVDKIEVLPGETAEAKITFFWGEYISSYMKINARFYIVKSFNIKIGEFNIISCVSCPDISLQNDEE